MNIEEDVSRTLQAVRVHVVADSTKAAAVPAPGRRRAVRYRTITLSSAAPIATVAGTEPLRDCLVVRATGNNVYLCAAEAEAKAVVGAGTGGGLDTAYLLPSADTAPTRYEGTEQVWAAATTYPAVLSVMIVTREA